jgi:hypothetical protein
VVARRPNHHPSRAQGRAAERYQLAPLVLTQSQRAPTMAPAWPGVISISAVDSVVAVAAVDRVVAGRSGQIVVAVAAVDGLARLGHIGHADVDRLRAAGAEAVGRRDEQVVDIIVVGIFRRLEIRRGEEAQRAAVSASIAKNV